MRNVIRQITSAALVVLTGLPHTAIAQSPDQPRIPWRITSQYLQDFDLSRDTTIAHGGRASVRIRADDDPRSFATLAAYVPAESYRGKQIRLSAWVRAESLATGAIWTRADGGGRP